MHDPCETSPVQPRIYPSPAHHGSATNSGTPMETPSAPVSVSLGLMRKQESEESLEWRRLWAEVVLMGRESTFSHTSIPGAVKEHHGGTLTMGTPVPPHPNTCCSSICCSTKSLPLLLFMPPFIPPSMHPIHSSIEKTEVVVCKVLGSSRAASGRHCYCETLQPLLQISKGFVAAALGSYWKSDTEFTSRRSHMEVTDSRAQSGYTMMPRDS